MDRSRRQSRYRSLLERPHRRVNPPRTARLARFVMRRPRAFKSNTLPAKIAQSPTTTRRPNFVCLYRFRFGAAWKIKPIKRPALARDRQARHGCPTEHAI
jgi:hypothetical protein